VPKPIKKRRVAAKRKKAAKRPVAALPPSPAVEPPSPEHEAAYVEALIENGQAAPVTRSGKLPRGATHAIVEDEQGQVKVVRRRFSIA
jgi:hypothetical protein